MVRYILFLLSVVGGFFLAQVVGTQFLVQVMAQCQGMLQTFGIAAAIIVLVAGVGAMLREAFGLDDSIIGMLSSIVVGAVATALLPIVFVLTLGQLSPVKAVFCFDCAPPKKGAELIQQGDFAGARVLLENFLKDEATRLEQMPAETPDALKEQAQGCIGDAEIQLAQAYYELAAVPVDELRDLDAPGTDEAIASCQAKVAQAQDLLNAAHTLAERHDLKALLSAIKEREQRLADAAQKCEPGVLLTTETVSETDGAMSFVARLQKRLDTGNEPVEDAADELMLKSDDGQVDAQIVEHKADEQVCMLLLSDSSGSVGVKGLEQVRAAVTLLNSYRKPADFYNVLPFSGEASTKDIVQMTSLEPINIDLLNIKGNDTHIWDAVNIGIQSMSTCESSVQKKTVVLLTDGKDTGSAYMESANDAEQRAESLHKAALAADVDLCVIAVTAGAQQDKDSAGALNTLATGCGFHYVDDFEGLADEFASIFGISGHYYSVNVSTKSLSPKDPLKLCHTPSETCVAVTRQSSDE